MIADRLLSAYIINLEEHSNIVHKLDEYTKLIIFKTVISRSDKGALRSLKDICMQLHIRCILFEDEESLDRGAEENSTGDALLSSQKLNWFLRQGFCLKSKCEGSIILTFDYSDPLTLVKCLDECQNGNIVNFLKEIFTDEPVLKTIPEGEHRVHVEINSRGTSEIIVILTSSFLDRKKMCHQQDDKVPKHDVYICEEIEVTSDLITQLQDEHVLPENISFKQFDNIEGRRNTIHDLLCLCDRSFDYRKFYYIIRYQNSDETQPDNQHTMYTCSCKIIKREGSFPHMTCELIKSSDPLDIGSPGDPLLIDTIDLCITPSD